MSGEHDPARAGTQPSPEPDEADPQAAPAQPGHDEHKSRRAAKREAKAAEQSQSENMLPRRRRRRLLVERFVVRLVATGGIIGIGVAIGAIMTSSHSQGWLIGLVIAVVSVVLAAILWSSREL